MNAETQNQNIAPQAAELPQVPAPTAAQAAATEVPALSDIDKAYYSPAELQLPETQAAINTVNTILAQHGVKPVYNFDPAVGITEGFGLAIQPITERVAERGNVVKGCAIVQVPDPATVAAHEKGAEYINTAILRGLISKLSSAVRSASASIPSTLEDFLTPARGGEGLTTYRELAPHFVKGLKKMGFSIMNAQLLRQIFSSAEFANDQFEKIEQEKWEYLLDLMISQALEKKLDPAILNHWKETRNTTQMKLAEDFDLETFAGLID